MNRYAPPKARVSDPPEVGSWVTGGLALFFAICSLYFGWTLSYQVSRAPPPYPLPDPALAALVACLGATAAIGLWLQRPWSQWVVYLISTLLIVFCAWYVWSLVHSGWPYESVSRSFAWLLPWSLLLMFAVATAVHVASLFRKR